MICIFYYTEKVYKKRLHKDCIKLLKCDDENDDHDDDGVLKSHYIFIIFVVVSIA